MHDGWGFLKKVNIFPLKADLNGAHISIVTRKVNNTAKRLHFTSTISWFEIQISNPVGDMVNEI